MKQKRKMGRTMRAAYDFITANPGCTIRDVARAVCTETCKECAMYESVHRLIRTGRVWGKQRGWKYSLVAVPDAN